MIVSLLKLIFGKVIGKFPKEKKEYFWKKFSELLVEITSASSEGAVRGMRDR